MLSVCVEPLLWNGSRGSSAIPSVSFVFCFWGYAASYGALLGACILLCIDVHLFNMYESLFLKFDTSEAVACYPH